MSSPLQTLLLGWRAQFAGNPRLRAGTLLIVGILWLYGLLLGADGLAEMSRRVLAQDEQAVRLAALSREKQWPQRADDARQVLQAWQATVWEGKDLGLVEADFQDWLRATAGKAGLKLRDLNVSRGAGQVPAVAAAASATTGAVPPPQAIRARVTAEFSRIGLLAFLAEAGRNERMVVVDRLLIRTNAQPPLLELELRILAQPRAKAAP